MSHIVFRIEVIVMLVAMGVYEVKSESSWQTNLLLNVKCMNLSGQTTNEFAVNEPVWFSVELINNSPASVSVWVDGDKNRGITCRPAKVHGVNPKLIYQRFALERVLRKTVLAPRDRLRTDVPLGDFIKIQDAGALHVVFGMQVEDASGASILLKETVPLQFVDGLSAQGVVSLVACLQQQFDSGDENMRIRMVRSCSSLPASEVLGFLAKALSDNDELVQLTALDVLSTMNMPRDATMQLLHKAAQSEQESVRLRAMDIERHQRQ